MFNSGLEEEYTLDEIRQIYQEFKWNPEYLNITSDLFKSVGAFNGLRLWVEFADFRYKGKEVIAALGFNESFIVTFDIGESEPQEIYIGCYGKPPLIIEIEKTIDANTSRYVFIYSIDECEIYRSEVDCAYLASFIPSLADRVIKACAVICDEVVS